MNKLIYKSFSHKCGYAPWNSICPTCQSKLVYIYGSSDVFDNGLAAGSVSAHKCNKCGWWGIQSLYEEEDSGYSYITHINSELIEYRIDEIETPTNALVTYLNSKPKDISLIHPKKMEDIVGGIYKEVLDCKVEFTKRTRDGGKDLICFNSDKGKFYVEIKRYNSPIGISTVQRFVGVLYQNGINTGSIVTSGTYSSDAINAANDSNKCEFNCIKLELNDYNDMLCWLSSYSNNINDEQIYSIRKIALTIPRLGMGDISIEKLLL